MHIHSRKNIIRKFHAGYQTDACMQVEWSCSLLLRGSVSDACNVHGRTVRFGVAVGFVGTTVRSLYHFEKLAQVRVLFLHASGMLRCSRQGRRVRFSSIRRQEGRQAGSRLCSISRIKI